MTDLRETIGDLGLGPADAGDLAVAAGAALEGGRAAMAWFERDDLEVDDRGRGPVTAADRDAHRAILGRLDRERPDDAVVSEEGIRDRRERAGGRLWVVDPLDGTREFIDGIDEFSVMVGLAVDGEARLGAVLRPALDRLYLGGVGLGAWEVSDATGGPAPRTKELRVEERPPRDPIRFVRSRSHPDEAIRRLEATLGEIAVILSGSVGTKCAKIAVGEADLYVHPVPYLKEWDTCAPEAILRGAGGRVTDCRGERLRYGEADPAQPGGIFAADPGTWARVADVVSRVTQTS